MTGQSKLLTSGVAALGKRLGIAFVMGVLLQIYKSKRRSKSNRDASDKTAPRSWQDFLKGAMEWPTFLLCCNLGTRVVSMGSNDRDGLAAAGLIATMAAHTVAPILSSDIALYALLRSLYSYHKLNDWTVTSYHVFAIIYPLIAWQATYQCKYMQPGQRSLYFDVGKYNMELITQMYNPANPPADGSLPKCEDCSQYHPKMTCNESIYNEFTWRIWKFFSVYLKYYGAVLAYSLISNPSTRKAWASNPLMKLINFGKDTMRSTVFLFLITSVALQYPCWLGKHCGKWHEHVFILYSMFVGHLALRFEKPERRAALALFCTWRVCQQMIRRMLDIKSYESTRGTFLDSKPVPGIMFGGACFLWLLCKDNPKVMKGMDKSIVDFVMG